MNIKILYDNEALDGFKCGWGFAALIDEDTLFDTGENAGSLQVNMKALCVDPAQIAHVVISHEDWDHVGGIEVLRKCGQVRVYLPAGTSTSLKKEIIDVNPRADVTEAPESMIITNDKFVMGTLGNGKKEMSLAAKTPKGLIIITGCAHPGLECIIDKAREFGNVRAVLGGFHGFDHFDALADVPDIIPCHCTQKKAELQAKYPEKVRFVSAGTELEF